MEICPQLSRVVIEPIEDPEEKIIVPDVAEDQKYQRSRVVAVGPGRILDNGTTTPVPLNVGDEVVFQQQYAVRLTPESLYGGRKLAIIDYGFILAVVKRDANEPLRAHRIKGPIN